MILPRIGIQGRNKLLCLAVMAGTLSGCNSDKKGDNQQPNIIVVLVDDMGWQDTSVPFHSEVTPLNVRYHTPAMERMASEGMKFTQAYASAVCSPTRVSLLSGMNAARHRVTNWTLNRNASNDAPDDVLEMPLWNMNGLQPVDTIENAVHVTPLPLILSNEGYYTIHCGKAHFGARGTPGENPLNLGFDVNIAGHAAGGPGSFLGENNYSASWRNGGSRWDVPGLEKYHGTDTYLTEALTREALDALSKPIEAGQPFFLYMAHYAVHVPIEADKRFISKYQEAGLDETEAAYASMVEGMDKSLGDLMNFLDEHDLADNTIILFMSDNGGLSAHGRGGRPHAHNSPLKSGKGSAYEGGIRVPLLVKWPEHIKKSSVCTSPVIIEDFFPTITEIAGAGETQTIQQIDGESFLPYLLNEKQIVSDNRLFVWHYPNKWGASGPGIGTTSTIRQGNFKLIYWYKTGQKELYNIEHDLGEEYNLAMEYPEKVTELSAELGQYLRSVKAQRPLFKDDNNPAPWPDELQ